MIKIVADENIPFLKGALEPFAKVIYLPGKQIAGDNIKDADALLIRTRTICTESLLKGTNVSFIGTATIGFDHIDTQYCETHGIHWTNAPGCNSSSVQQYIASALLKMARDYQFNLYDKTIGIVGVGNVGTKVEKIAGTLGMNVLLNDPPRARKEGSANFVMFDKILDDSDIITVHVPLNRGGEDNTYHLFDEVNFKKMRKGAWYINSSRGEVNATISLKNAIESGNLGGVVLDVWENEPDINTELMSEAFIATPHIAGYSTDGKANGTAMVVNALCRFFDLPLAGWFPSGIPKPSSTDLFINCTGKSDEDVLREAVFQTYNIEEDDIKFRISPADFEKQRGSYPLRREFTSYSVILQGGTNNVHQMLEFFGFNVIS